MLSEYMSERDVFDWRNVIAHFVSVKACMTRTIIEEEKGEKERHALHVVFALDESCLMHSKCCLHGGSG